MKLEPIEITDTEIKCALIDENYNDLIFYLAHIKADDEIIHLSITDQCFVSKALPPAEEFEEHMFAYMEDGVMLSLNKADQPYFISISEGEINKCVLIYERDGDSIVCNPFQYKQVGDEIRMEIYQYRITDMNSLPDESEFDDIMNDHDIERASIHMSQEVFTKLKQL